ncbi:hypothetical protein [Priestia aryabhattai]|uniref:hypothetical protein n=1 Tax=Priestia aryabhattai TaxID=412384 RepID=UPI0030EC531A
MELVKVKLLENVVVNEFYGEGSIILVDEDTAIRYEKEGYFKSIADDSTLTECAVPYREGLKRIFVTIYRQYRDTIYHTYGLGA